MRVTALIPLLIVACSGNDPAGPSCPTGETMRNGACVVRFDDCGDHAVAIKGGGCKPVGVIDCGQGFASDGAGGCNAVLPTDACADGTYALPGDAACHPVPCDEPDATSAIHVDAAAATGGDGTAGKPFRTLTAAIGAAAAGSTIVVAPATYEENIEVAKAVKIYGKCGGEVFVRGRDTARATFQITAPAELHQLSVGSAYVGVLAGNISGIVLDRLWLHDVARNGVYVLDEGPGADVTLRDIFVERSKGAAIVVSSANATIERLAVRNMNPHAAVPTTSGYALHLRHQDVSGTPREKGAKVTLTLAHFDRTSVVGIVNESSELHAERVYLHDVRGVGETGYGIISGTSKTVMPRAARLELVSSVVERVISQGVMIQGGSARIEGCTFRSVTPTPKGARGFGVSAAADPTLPEPIPAELDIVNSIVRDTNIVGLTFFAANGSVRDTIVRSVQPKTDGLFGDGFSFTGGTVTVERALALQAARAGVSVFGADVTLSDSTLRCSPLALNTESSARDKMGMVVTAETHLTDGGGNACGCTADLAACKAQSSGLEPIDTR